MSEIFDAYESALKDKGRGRSISISGAGMAGGGYYEKVSINGSGKIEGDVEAKEVRVAGSAFFKGSLTADNVKAAGAIKVYGTLRARKASFAGAIKVNGCLDSEELSVAGAVSAGCLKSAKARIEGGIRVSGEVTGDIIEFKILDDSVMGEVKVRKLEVLRARSYNFSELLKSLLGKMNPTLEARKIEAEEVVFSDVTVRAPVYAKRIILVGKTKIEGEIQGELIRKK